MIQGVWVSLDNTLKGENHDKEKSDICSYNYDDADPGGGMRLHVRRGVNMVRCDADQSDQKRAGRGDRDELLL